MMEVREGVEVGGGGGGGEGGDGGDVGGGGHVGDGADLPGEGVGRGLLPIKDPLSLGGEKLKYLSNIFVQLPGKEKSLVCHNHSPRAKPG